MNELTYSRLDQILASIGFTLHRLGGKARRYRHEVLGAQVTLPPCPDQDIVSKRHLMAVRTVLDANGISEPVEFDRAIQRAG